MLKSTKFIRSSPSPLLPADRRWGNGRGEGKISSMFGQNLFDGNVPCKPRPLVGELHIGTRLNVRYEYEVISVLIFGWGIVGSKTTR
jgi:hypothetical protein